MTEFSFLPLIIGIPILVLSSISIYFQWKYAKEEKKRRLLK